MFLSRASCRSADLSPLVVYSAFLPSEFFPPDGVNLRLTTIPLPDVATPSGLMQVVVMMVVMMVMNVQRRGT